MKELEYTVRLDIEEDIKDKAYHLGEIADTLWDLEVIHEPLQFVISGNSVHDMLIKLDLAKAQINEYLSQLS